MTTVWPVGIRSIRTQSSQPWLERGFLVYGHQGGAREAPSSTLHAIRQAIAVGSTAIELDVHRTADGVLVVCHDATVDRTTNGFGRIDTFTFEELRSLDNAYWWAPGHQAVHTLHPNEYPLRGRYPDDDSLGIVRLDDVLDEFRGVFLNFDIKETAPDSVSYEQELADAIRRFDRCHDSIVASFHDIALDRFRAIAPDIATSCGPTESIEAFGAVMRGDPIAEPSSTQVAFQLPLFFDGNPVVDANFVAAAHTAGYAVHVWTVDDHADIELALDAGVDGIISDYPTRVVDCYRTRPR